MLSNSSFELEANNLTSEARYRELVQEILSVVRRNSAQGVVTTKELAEIDKRRQSKAG
jgi:hypothetical protein